MTFNDKFKFLMDITNTNNTTLAGAVGIDNSAVSLYRSGKRKCPRNKEILRRMSDYFASSIKLSYQRKALALASDYSRFNHSRPLPEYSDMLYQWLADELPQTNTLVDGILNENISNSLDKIYFSRKLVLIMEELDGYCSRDVPVQGIIFVILFL